MEKVTCDEGADSDVTAAIKPIERAARAAAPPPGST